MLRKAIAIVLLLSAQVLAFGQAERSIDDFAFVHVTDMHISPHLVRTGEPGPPRGAESIAWICENAAGPQTMAPFGITTPAPAFALATGDLTEYGVIDDTWSLFEQAFASLPYPLYVLPGNHDNTWVAMYHIMRERYGGENYSFDKFGCHFVCICSASPQEPVPSIDATTRTWLKRDLESIPPGTPVFVALHHPPYSNEFANPAEYDTLIDLLRDYNVVLMLYGHGHSVSHRNLDGIDGVMGGSTFGKNAGYGVISVQDGVLRVAYRFHERRNTRSEYDAGLAPPNTYWWTLLQKPLETGAPQRLFCIEAPRPGDVVAGKESELVLKIAEGVEEPQRLVVSPWIDQYGASVLRLRGRDRPTWRVQPNLLKPGWHMLTVRGELPDGPKDLDTVTFRVEAEPERSLWRVELPAAVKAGPVVAGDKLIVARTDGVVTALQRRTGKELWSFKTGGEILGTPAWFSGALVFGSGDGKVYALDNSGKQLWNCDVELPVYGWPLIEGETAYIGDNGGRMHALDLKTGAECWTFSRADYSIECKPCLWGDLLVFGAWDGYLYALRRSDGKLQWKALGPKASEGKASRYYAPADCGPAAIADKLFVCDRGYYLGTFDRAGVQGQRVDEGISGIAGDPSGQYVYARSKDDRVCKFNAAGEKLWERALPAGRFPIPPTPTDDAVYVCSNAGLLSVLDADHGGVRWQYQVTPGFYVMAPVTVDDAGVYYVAGMDGTVTALSARLHPKRDYPAGD